MAFRSDDVAMRAKAAALEKEVARLQKENESLREEASRGKPIGVGLWLALLVSTLAICAGAFIAATGAGIYERVGLAVSGTGAVVLFIAIALVLLGRLLVVVHPSRLVVVSGRRHPLPDGSLRGYRIYTDGRVLRLPLIEQAEELPTGPFTIEATIEDVATRRDSRATIRYRLVAGVAREEPRVTRAVERFLGRSEEELSRAIEEVMEGVLRGVAASFDAAEIAEDRLRFAHAVIAEAEHDLDRMGFVVDVFKVLDVRSLG